MSVSWWVLTFPQVKSSLDHLLKEKRIRLPTTSTDSTAKLFGEELERLENDTPITRELGRQRVLMEDELRHVMLKYQHHATQYQGKRKNIYILQHRCLCYTSSIYNRAKKNIYIYTIIRPSYTDIYHH